MPGTLDADPSSFDDFVAQSTSASFPPGYRGSGLLLHITSLPAPYGIGDLGRGAYMWIDRLEEAGQGWWQILPVGPTGYGNSPYQGVSSFAGNGLFISPQLLIEDGILEEDDCRGAFSSTTVDYEVVIPFKRRLLELAWKRFRAGIRQDLIPEYEHFCLSRFNWLEDYALFRALKTKYNGAHYLEWPAELVKRKPIALARARRELASEIDRFRLEQFLLHRQARHLRAYAHAKGVRLIGDLPFFVSPDSSDVWANPEFFLLDSYRHPRFVGGVPPDYFSAGGQLWGNPVYDWEALRSTNYAWWIERLRVLLEHVDVIRLDHFRAFAAAWHIPAGSPTAQVGDWVFGPGSHFFQIVKRELGGLPFLAEDLGLITPDVLALRDQFQLPGTRVLQFGFDGDMDNVHLPHRYSANTVAYTGTHDNATTREWFETMTGRERKRVWTYLGQARGDIRDASHALIRRVWLSPAMLAIAPLQDLLNLGREGRMNTPGVADGNWRWRCTGHMLHTRSFRWLRDLTMTSSRTGNSELPSANPQANRTRAASSR